MLTAVGFVGAFSLALTAFAQESSSVPEAQSEACRAYASYSDSRRHGDGWGYDGWHDDRRRGLWQNNKFQEPRSWKTVPKRPHSKPVGP